jgi:serine/threonine protein kinase
MINNKYTIERYLSQGNFGSVYECSYNNKKYAVKCDSDSKLLKYEAGIYKELRYVRKISTLVDFFLFGDKYYMVLDLFDLNFKDFKDRFCNSEYYLERLIETMSKVIDTLRDIHNCGIVHRDLKPPNICLNKNFEPYIIDFGMAKKIIINNQHIEERNIKNIIGSPNYASLNVVNLKEPTRRDDMESLIYVYMFMLLSTKEYIAYTNNRLIIQKSASKISEILLKNNVNLKLVNILMYLRKLNFSQKPNYEYIKTLIMQKNVD